MNKIYIVEISNLKWNEIKRNLILFDDKKKEIEAMRFDEDKCRSLVGRLILLHHLKITKNIRNYEKLRIGYTTSGKPFIREIQNVHFNISHSSVFVACAISSCSNIGIDIELIKEVSFSDYIDVFTFKEYFFITRNKNPLISFYKLWTLKESLLKAVGCGFNINPRQLEVLSNPLLFMDDMYYFKTMQISPQLVLSVCSPEIKDYPIVKLSLSDILIY